MNKETRETLHSSKKTDWGTPKELFDEWNKRWGPFTLDPCTSPDNPLGTPYFFTEEDDGLSQNWLGHRVYMNPPYGRQIGKWIKKAWQESKTRIVNTSPMKGACAIHNRFADFKQVRTVVVCLLPAHTGTKWFHDYVLPYGEIIFLPGRIKFVGAKWPAPFDSMLVIFR